MRMARSQIGVAGQHALAMHGLPDRDPAQAVEPLRERAREALRHVLHDQDTGTVGGHLLQELADGLGPAGRCADDDQFLARAERHAQRSHRAPCIAAGAMRSKVATAVRTICLPRPSAYSGMRRYTYLFRDQLGIVAHAALYRDLGLGDKVHRAQFECAQRRLGAALGQR